MFAEARGKKRTDAGMVQIEYNEAKLKQKQYRKKLPHEHTIRG